MRQAFELGRYKLRIEETSFSLARYNAFVRNNAPSIAAFKTRQQAAFEAERERWRATGQAEYADDHPASETQRDGESDLLPNGNAVSTQVAGSVWKVRVKPGDMVTAGATLVIVESMKMEIAICAPRAGRVGKVLCEKAHRWHPARTCW